MTHFTLLVTKVNKVSIGKQLEPFAEYLEVEEYMVETKSQLLENAKKRINEDRKVYEEYFKDPIEYAKKASKHMLNYIENEFPKKLMWTDEEIYQDRIKYCGTDKKESIWLDANGNLWTSYNPDSKYDWYVVGGRWSGYFATKVPNNELQLGVPGVFDNEPRDGYVDIIKVKDIDWERMQLDEIEERSIYFDEQLSLPEKDRFVFNPYYKVGMTKEEYVNRPFSKATFAVLHDGQWHERGEMGWFAHVANEKDEDAWEKEFDMLIKSLNQNDEIALVDCHI